VADHQDVSTADVVVIGRAQRLVCAAYLAEAGQVIVLEANDHIGGNTVTASLRAAAGATTRAPARTW
jgi:phytoene dehydrogenase-like protein